MTTRIARFVAMAVAILGAIVLMGAALNGNVQPDADAYFHAAQRLRDGQALYGGPRGDETEIYRYAPWFAYAWVPLSYLGQDGAYLVWRGLLLLSTFVAVWPLLRRPTPAGLTLAILLGGLLMSNLPAANVTPLLVGALSVSLRSRAGPVILGMAASLKVFPLILLAGYLAERRWFAAVVSVAVAGGLWLHVLAFDLTAYAGLGGPSFYVGGVSLYGVFPGAWAATTLVLGSVLVWLVWRGSPWSWLVASVAIPVAVPRVWLPEAGYLLAGISELLRGPRRA
jgi:hypothetical protein